MYGHAIEALRKAIDLEPNLLDGHYTLADAFYHQGDLKNAVASYRRAIELKPDYAIAHYNLGQCLRQLGVKLR